MDRTKWRQMPVDGAFITDLAFLAGGQQLISASSDGKVRIWTVADGTVAATVSVSRYPERLAVDSLGRRIAIVTRSGDVDVVSWPDGVVSRIRTGTLGECWGSVAFTASGELLVGGAKDSGPALLEVWAAGERTCSRTVEAGGGWVLAIATSSDGGTALATSKTLFLGNVEAPGRRLLDKHAKGWSDVAFSVDGERLAAIRPHMLEIWNRKSLVREQQFDGRRLRRAAWLGDSSKLVCSGVGDEERQKLGFYDAEATDPMGFAEFESGSITALASDSSGTLLAWGGYDKGITVAPSDSVML